MPRVTPSSPIAQHQRIAADVQSLLNGSLQDPTSPRGKWGTIFQAIRPLCDQNWTTPRIINLLVKRKHITATDARRAEFALYRWRRVHSKTPPKP